METATKFDIASIEPLLSYLTESERAELDGLLEGYKPPFDQWLPLVTPEYNWDFEHLRYIRHQLAGITDGAIKKLMLFMPPQHGKSEMTTVRYAAWRLEQDPTLRIVVGAYSQDYANSLSRKIKRIAAGRIALATDRNAVDEWETTSGGGIKAVGVGSGVTGRPADLLIIDDPVKSREEADSQAYRDRVYEWYSNDLITRRSNRFAIILIQTRWHEDDLAGRILKSVDAPRWSVVSLPALAEANDPLGRMVGEALCPELHSRAEILETQSIQGERHFAALYQQQPRPAEGVLFKAEWFKGRVIPYAPAGLTWVRFWDLATSSKTSADYTVGALVGMDGQGNFYLQDVHRGRWEYPDGRREMIKTAHADGEDVQIGIENVAFQLAAIQDLRRSPDLLRYRIRDVHPDKDKISRALLWADKAESGQVFLVEGHWNDAFIEECLSFAPHCQHDDQVDAVSGAVKVLTRRRTLISA